MGLLQSPPTAQPTTPVSTTTANPVFSSDPCCYEVFRYFSVDPFANKDPQIEKQVTEIGIWSKDGTKDLGDALWKIRNLEGKLGVPTNGETRYSKMYNYIKMARITEKIEKDRNTQLEKVKVQRQAQINKMSKQLKELEAQKKAELSEIKKQHDKRLEPLKKMRSAFEQGV